MRTFCLPLLVVAVACTSSGNGGEEAPPDAGPGNRAPRWTGVERLSIVEGGSATLVLSAADDDGDALVMSAVATDGLELAGEGTSRTVRARYGLVSPAITVTLEDGASAPVTHVVPVDAMPIRWGPRTTWTEPAGPEAREHAAILADEDAGAIHVIFGSGYSPYGEILADAWTFNTTTLAWTASTLAGDVPAAAGSPRMVDLGTPGAEGLMFGGYFEGQLASGELTRVTASGDTLTFTTITQVNPPPARFLHLFAHDPVGGRFVVFGGGGTSFFGDTWLGTLEDNTMTWSRLTTGPMPSARFGMFHGVDPAEGVLWMWSGQGRNGRFEKDTWVLDLRAASPTWDIVPELDENDPAAPPGRRNGSYVMDPSGPRLWVFGGTFDGMTSAPGLWALRTVRGQARWDRVDAEDAPPLRSSGIAVFLQGGAWMGFGNDSTAYRDMARVGP